MELKFKDLDVTEDLLKEINNIQRKYDKKFRISALGEGRLSDGRQIFTGITIYFDLESIDSVIDLLSLIKSLKREGT